MFIPNPCSLDILSFPPRFFSFTVNCLFFDWVEMQQPGYKCVLPPKLTPTSRFLDCCHHNIARGSLSTGFTAATTAADPQSYKIIIMFLSPSGQCCPLRLNLLRKGESTNSSGYMCTLCTLHPSVILKWKTGAHLTFIKDHLPQKKTLWFEEHVDGISVWYCLTRVTGSVWWMLAAHILEICATEHGWCLLSTVFFLSTLGLWFLF